MQTQKRRKQGQKIIGKNNGLKFSIWYIYLQTQVAQLNLSKINTKKTTPKYIVVKLMKTKVKDKNLKAIRGEKDDIIQENKNINDGAFIISNKGYQEKRK